jgi:hypothetical protein
VWLLLSRPLALLALPPELVLVQMEEQVVVPPAANPSRVTSHVNAEVWLF